MSKKLTKYVYVVDEDGRNVVLEPGSTVPSWAKDQVTNDKAFEGEDEAPAPAPPPEPEEAKPLKDRTVEELDAELAARNADRDDDAKIVVGGKGNKVDKVRALQADDAAQQ